MGEGYCYWFSQSQVVTCQSSKTTFCTCVLHASLGDATCVWAHNIGFAIGRFPLPKINGLNPGLIELDEMKTRISFFWKLDRGKYCSSMFKVKTIEGVHVTHGPTLKHVHSTCRNP